jgi:hypothetical protein
MIEIDREKALALLAAEVRTEGPQFVYKRDERVDENGDMQGINCRYVEDGNPSCLVGRVLFRAGVPIEAIHNLDTQWNGMSESIGDAKFPDDVNLTLDAREVLQAAQTSQDAGQTWGEALRSALSVDTDD